MCEAVHTCIPVFSLSILLEKGTDRKAEPADQTIDGGRRTKKCSAVGSVPPYLE